MLAGPIFANTGGNPGSQSLAKGEIKVANVLGQFRPLDSAVFAIAIQNSYERCEKDCGALKTLRVYCISRREGPKVPVQSSDPGELWMEDSSCVRLRPERAEWEVTTYFMS